VVTTFDGALAPHGEFFDVPGLGRVWRPRARIVGAGFVPYATGGRWVYAMNAWTFDSPWSFGWVVFHYGQWVDLPELGWVWVPGSDWAPAWVEWQFGGGYVAWAPTPPRRMVADWRPRWCLVEATALVTIDAIERHLLPAHHFHLAAPVMTRMAPDRGYSVSFGPPRDYAHRRPWTPAPREGISPPPGQSARPPAPPPGPKTAPRDPSPPAVRPPSPQPPPPPGQPSKRKHPDDRERRPRGEPQAQHQLPERYGAQHRHG
jgi:hypothetical protein